MKARITIMTCVYVDEDEFSEVQECLDKGREFGTAEVIGIEEIDDVDYEHPAKPTDVWETK